MSVSKTNIQDLWTGTAVTNEQQTEDEEVVPRRSAVTSPSRWPLVEKENIRSLGPALEEDQPPPTNRG